MRSREPTPIQKLAAVAIDLLGVFIAYTCFLAASKGQLIAALLLVAGLPQLVDIQNSVLGRKKK